MSDEQRQMRRRQRESTDRFIASLRDGLEHLETLSGNINRARELDGQIRDSLPPGEVGDTLREWLDSHDGIADELQATCERLVEVLGDGVSQVAATEVYLNEIEPHPDDPRDAA